MGTSDHSPIDQVKGPAVPTAQARAVQRPLGIGDVSITAGPFGQWQRVNRSASIPLGLEQMEEAATLPNLRLVAGEADGEFRGPRFSDSDLYKQLEAVAWEYGREPSDQLRTFVRESAQLLTKAQREDGYLNSYYQYVKPDEQYADLQMSHEMYCAGHLFQAAVAEARVGGDSELLAVARRFADHLVEVFLRGGNTGIDGHPEVETALVELYRVTGERSYLDLAKQLIDERGKGYVGKSGMGKHYLQDHLPVREADTAVGHAVRQLYLEAGIVDVYLETGDSSLLECSIRRWDDMVATKTTITGSLGSRHSHEAFGDRYELPPDRSYNETCAAIASIHWSWRLLLATGHGRYADLIERTLYNGFAGSTSADGTKFFYVNPLQRRYDHIEGDDPGRRKQWYSCACCPPNIMRLISSLGHYVATTSGDTLSIQQYLPGGVRATLPSGVVELTVQTDYPWAGSIGFTVDQTPDSEWTLALRIPQWSKAVRVSIGGQPYNGNTTPDEDGYVRLTRSWRAGDVVELELDLSPRLSYPHRRIDALRGCVAIEHGPLVYCVEQVDNANDVDELSVAAGTKADALRVHEPTEIDGIGRTVTIEFDAYTVSQPLAAELPYFSRQSEDLSTSTATTATAIPYFQWDNRDGGAMRVWLPVLDRSGHASPIDGTESA